MPVVLNYYSHSQHDYTVCVKVCVIVHFYAAEITLESQCLKTEMGVIVNFVCENAFNAKILTDCMQKPINK